MSRVDQRQRAVLEFAGRVGFGVDVGDFLELQRAFESDRVVVAAAEEQRVVLVGEAAGPALDLRFQCPAPCCTATGRWRRALRCFVFLGVERRPRCLGQHQRQQRTARRAGW